jgi:glucose/mannose-6-phosphate isomerase
MFSLIGAMPEHLRASATLPGLAGLKALSRRPRQILLCGMGGSAIAGDLLRPLLHDAGLHLTVWRDYGLPGWVDGETLVVASSYSGNTEETLSAVQAAQDRRCVVLALTSGGRLLELGRPGDRPDSIPTLQLPAGLPPRASLGYSLGALLWGWHRWGLIPSPEAEIAGACAVLDEGNRLYGLEEEAPTNEARTLAASCQDRFSAIYATGQEAIGAALRWKTQFNENAKSPAYAVEFPEVNHNDIVGWQLTPAQREAFVLFILRSADEDERVARRVTLTKDLLAHEFREIRDIQSRGRTRLARILSLVQLGDYVSCYLAMNRGVDCMSIARIDVLKERLQAGDPP